MSNSCIHACKTIVQMCEEARAMGKKHLRINKIENLADQAVQEDLSEERNKRSNWHTGTPTEEGYYLCHIQFYSEDYESDEEGYDFPYWFKNGSWEGNNENVRIIAWQNTTPYQGEKNNG